MKMGVWGTAISSNDTYADIHAGFFDMYNDRTDVKEISAQLVSTHQDIINDPDDCNNFWFALAKAQWECKGLDPDLLNKIRSIVSDGKDLESWRRLGASEKDITKRKSNLDKFINEISVTRLKAKAKKTAKIVEPAFAKGDCVTFKLSSGNYGGFVVLEAQYHSTQGYNLIAGTSLNQVTKPTERDFKNSNVLVLNFASWNNRPLIIWIVPIKQKLIEHLFERIGNIEVKTDYDIKDYKYSYGGNFKTHTIDVMNLQFDHDPINNGNKDARSIKSLIKRPFKLW